LEYRDPFSRSLHQGSLSSKRLAYEV
jgi:hypothetical protein